MNFFVGTKKLLYGFPLITIPPSQEINVNSSISQQICTTDQDINTNNNHSNTFDNDQKSVISHYNDFSSLSSSDCPFNSSTIDATIQKILLYRYRTITNTRLAQILRVRIFF